MIQLKISKNQSDKLLEICKELFPEYDNLRWGRLHESNFIWFDSIPKSAPDPTEIHWFELVMTEIPIRLHKRLAEAMKIATSGIRDDKSLAVIAELYEPSLLPLDVLDLLIMKSDHPIDTIWEEYKKLKTWLQSKK